jgi:hypothetical protein
MVSAWELITIGARVQRGFTFFWYGLVTGGTWVSLSTLLRLFLATAMIG